VRGSLGQNEKKTYFIFVFNTCTRYYVKYLRTISTANDLGKVLERKTCDLRLCYEKYVNSNSNIVMLYVVNMLMKKYFIHLCVRIIMITKTRTVLLYKQIIEQIL